MKLRSFAVLLSLGCTHSPAPGPAPMELRKFVDAYYAAAFARAPSLATRIGFHEYDAKLEDRSRGAIEARIAALKDELAQLDAIRRGQLSFDDAIDAQLIDNQIRGLLLELETIRVWEHNPMEYVRLPGGSIDGLMKRDFAPAKERLKSVIARLKQVPAVFAAAKANVQNPPKEFTELAVRMSKGSVGFFEKAVAAWARDAAGGDAALLAEFEQANSAAAAAARDLAGWLQTDLLLRSNGQYAIGAENFLAKLKYD